MKTRLLSALLVFLLVASVSIPAVSADGFATPVVVAIPEVAEVVIEGVTIIIGGATLVAIGNHLEKTWGGVAENFNDFASCVGSALNDLFAAPNWVDANSPEAKAVLTFDYYTASAGSGGKNDKLYHKAEWKNGKVKLDTKRISEKDAVKELKEGRDIFTAKKELAENLVNRVSKENHKALKLKGRPKNLKEEEIENHGVGKEGYYEHYHPEYQNTRPHCWFWRR